MSNNPSATSVSVGIRLNNELIAQVDELVTEGVAESRSALVRQAVELGLAQLGKQQTRRKASGRHKKAPAAALEPAEPAAAGLKLFAYWVLESAKRSKTGKFGDDRIFISHAWKQYKRDQKPKGMDLDGFKERLVEANRERFLSLVCADMAPMMDPTDVRESETHYLLATFHLLCIPVAR